MQAFILCVWEANAESSHCYEVLSLIGLIFFLIFLFSLAQGNISFRDWYCDAFFSPCFLTFTIPCPASFPVSHALLLPSLILWLLQYLLLVSVFSSFPSLFHRGTNIISEDCETANAPWHSWKPHDFGLSEYWLSLRLCVNELLLHRPILKAPAGTRKAQEKPLPGNPAFQNV